MVEMMALPIEEQAPHHQHLLHDHHQVVMVTTMVMEMMETKGMEVVVETTLLQVVWRALSRHGSRHLGG
jgi:hypothetical protein